jgi:hypothetical protein
LREVEARFHAAARFELFTGSRSEANVRLYQRHGYAIFKAEDLSPVVTVVYLEKRARTAPDQ